MALRIVRDDLVRGLQDQIRASIILIQCNDARALVVLIKLQDVRGIRPPPRINRLIIVAHHEHLLPTSRPLGERGGVGHRERHVEDLGQRLSQVRLAGTGRQRHQQDVRLLQLDVVARGSGVDALVVVVAATARAFLARLSGSPVQDVVDLFGFGDVPQADVLVDVLVELFLDDLVAELDALVADVDSGAC